VRPGGQRDDPGFATLGRAGGEGVVQANGQGEVAEMVGRELQFPPVRCSGQRRGHDAGISPDRLRLAPGRSPKDPRRGIRRHHQWWID
jgi:hypothetical protein